MQTTNELIEKPRDKAEGAFAGACALKCTCSNGNYHPVNEAAPGQQIQSLSPTQPISTMGPQPLKETHLKIEHRSSGYTYESLFRDYLEGAKMIAIDDPYIRTSHQCNNFLRFCELVVKVGSAQAINLTTSYDGEQGRKETEEYLKLIGSSLHDYGITMKLQFRQTLHDRAIRLDNGWAIQVGRGLDFYQRVANRFSIGASDYELRPCRETGVDIFRR